MRLVSAVMESNDNGESNGTQLLLPEGRSLKRKVTERSLKTPEGVSVYCLIILSLYNKAFRPIIHQDIKKFLT